MKELRLSARQWKAIAKAMRPAVISLRHSARSIVDALKDIDWEAADRLMKKFRKAKDLGPGHKAHDPWEIVGDMTARDLAVLEPHLPDPFARGRGRPPNDDALQDEMDPLINARMKPTTAARVVLKRHGFTGDELKGRADALVKRRKKTRASKIASN